LLIPPISDKLQNADSCQAQLLVDLAEQEAETKYLEDLQGSVKLVAAKMKKK
jgi:hypothetical protein